VSLVGGLAAQIIVSDGCISFRLLLLLLNCATHVIRCARFSHPQTDGQPYLQRAEAAAAGIQLTLCEKIRRGDELLRPSWQEIPFLARGLYIYILWL
jgi:hypothetical protein